MSKKVSPTQLRKNPYRLLDDLPRRQAIACSPDELVETSWEDSWGRTGMGHRG